nr:hypothetical protein [Nitrosomonas nitrosa]
MKYAIVDGERREALKGLRGACPICDAVLTPRCGRFRAAHWAHPPGVVDHHWEPETEWHRNWKALFPPECQEVVHQAGDGKKHIADVKTAHGQVIELQNSPLAEEERCSREEFYRPMCWIVNGQRLKDDRSQFFASLRLGKLASANPLTVLVPIERCMLLRKWADSHVLVLYDFGETEDEADALRFGAPVLWASSPSREKGKAVLTPVFRSVFLEAMTNGQPLIGMNFSKAFGQQPRLRPTQVVVSRPTGWKLRSRKFKRFGSRRGRGWSGSGMSARRRWKRWG